MFTKTKMHQCFNRRYWIGILGSSLLLLGLTGCADQPYYGRTVYEGQGQPVYPSSPQPPPPQYRYQEQGYQGSYAYSSRTGQVVEVRRTNVREARGLGAGAVVGALVGGVVGSTIGHGTGRTLATVGGAVAGGFAGNAIQNNHDDNQEGYLITVRLDNGNILQIAQDTHDWIQVGQRVHIDGYGNNLRVVPD